MKDLYNNLLDFIEMVHPDRVLSPHHKRMIKAMQDCAEYNMYKPCNTVTVLASNYPSDICKTDCPAPDVKRWGYKATKKEENPMASYASAQIIADTTEKDQRAYLTDRLYSIREEKKSDLRKQFGMIDDKAPATPAEFIQRIADGKYTIDKEKLDKKTYAPSDYIRWRDPSVVEDLNGYEAAKLKLDDAYRTAKDAAILSAIADAKTVMDTFKAWSLS